MNEKDFALECRRVSNLDFVNYADPNVDGSYVFVGLKSSLTALLPPGRSVLMVDRSDFSVSHVIDLYDRTVVMHLVAAADLAQTLLRSAQQQAKK